MGWLSCDWNVDQVFFSFFKNTTFSYKVHMPMTLFVNNKTNKQRIQSQLCTTAQLLHSIASKPWQDSNPRTCSSRVWYGYIHHCQGRIRLLEPKLKWRQSVRKKVRGRISPPADFCGWQLWIIFCRFLWMTTLGSSARPMLYVHKKWHLGRKGSF
jgi:hypothetical protein